jgi:hypothetical protein
MYKTTRFTLLLFLLTRYLPGYASNITSFDTTGNRTGSGISQRLPDQYELLCFKAEHATDADSIINYSDEAIILADYL